MAKSAVEHEVCTCGLEVRPEIWLCPHHIYRKGTQTFTSVSKVIKTVLPADYSKVDPTVLEIARLRGTFVDSYFSEWLVNPDGMMDLTTVEQMIAPEFPRDGEKHAKDTTNRIDMLLDWWIGKNWKVRAVQKIVYREAHGVAGQLDVDTEEMIVDVKCVAELQPNYKLQLGAYHEYSGDTRDPVGIVHVTKDKVKLVKYAANDCGNHWLSCVDWYLRLGELR